MGAANGRNGAEGAAVAAALADLQPCIGRTGTEQPARLGILQLQRVGQHGGPGIHIGGVQPQVNLGDLSSQFRHAVTAGQTAAHDEKRAFRQIFQIRSHLHDGSHGFLNRRADKGAGVDKHQIGFFGFGYGQDRLSERRFAQRTEQTLGIHPVLGTAKTLGINAQHADSRTSLPKKGAG